MSWTDELSKIKDDKSKQVENIKNQIVSLGSSLSPMVSAILIELGKALWGKGLFGYKYKLKEDYYTNSNNSHFYSWLLSNKRIDDIYNIRVSIYAPSISDYGTKHLHIDCDVRRFDHIEKSCRKASSDLSEQAFKKVLIDACQEMNWHPK